MLYKGGIAVNINANEYLLKKQFPVDMPYVPGKGVSNPLDGNRYIHYRKSQYEMQAMKANVPGMQRQAAIIYKQQSKNLINRFAKNEPSIKTSQEAIEALDTIEDVLNFFINNKEYEKVVGNTNVFLDDKYKVNDKSFWSYSQSKGKRDELFSDMNMLTEFIGKLNSAVNSFKTISPQSRHKIIAQYSKNTKDRGAAVKKINSASVSGGKVRIIGGDKTGDIADSSYKKLVIAIHELNKYVAQSKQLAAQGKAESTRCSDAQAREAVRSLSASLNGLKGNFFEMSVEHLVNNMSEEFTKALSEQKGVVITKATGEGQSTVSSDKTERKIVSKTDIMMSMTFGKNSTSMDVGLSLKTNKLDEKTGLRKTSLVGNANFGMLLRRANALNDESTYHIANLAVHKPNITSSKVFNAAKAKSSALMALDVLSGLGTKQDTSYFVMYTDKVLSMHKYLTQIGNDMLTKKEDEVFPFKMTITGMRDSSASTSKENKEYHQKREQFVKEGLATMQDNYVRSKECLKLVLDALKISISANTKS